jgi:hypothetical protein
MSATAFDTSAPGILGRDGEVAGEQLHERPADAIAVHHGDRRLVIAVETLPAPAVGRRRRLLALAGVLLQLAEKFLQVLSRAEISALAGDHHHLDIVIDLEPRKRVIHLVVQGGRHGISFFRPVERRPRDTIGQPHFYAFVLVVRHWLFPPPLIMSRVTSWRHQPKSFPPRWRFAQDR